MGALNYRSFILFVLCVSVSTLIFIGQGVAVIIQQGLSKKAPFGVGYFEISISLICVLVCINIGVFVFCLDLIYLHTKLLFFDFTTFEYIHYKKGRKERLKKLKKGVISKEEF